MTKPDALYCSFCGKSHREVHKLIAGPTVFICDECIVLCVEILIADERLKSSAYREMVAADIGVA